MARGVPWRWIPACAGMTERRAGMTEKGAGIVGEGRGNDGDGGVSANSYDELNVRNAFSEEDRIGRLPG